MEDAPPAEWRWAHDQRVYSLEEELRDPDVAIVLSMRAAMRAVPALSFLLNARSSRFKAPRSTSQVLTVFRAVHSCWVASTQGQSLDLRLIQDAGNAAEAAASGIDSEGRLAFFVPAYAAFSAARNEPSYCAAVAITGAPSANHFAAAGTAFPLSRNDTADRVEGRTTEATILDHDAIKRGFNLQALARQPIWHKKELAWTRNAWGWLKSALIATDEDWDVWVDWYEARLRGSSANDRLELARATVSEEIWRGNPKFANAHIKQLMEEFQRVATSPKSDSDYDPPIVPASRPAAVEPIWENGRLTIPTTPVKSDLAEAKFAAAFLSLRAEVRDFADDAAEEAKLGANIDHRFVSYLHRLAERMPDSVPTQLELFRLGHVKEVLGGYSRIVTDQWPDVLASRYHALALQFDRTMRQSPSWREFERNAAKQSLTAEQMSAGASLALEAASVLRDEDARGFVDPALAKVLEDLGEELLRDEQSPADLLASDPPEFGKESLTLDVVESVNNVFKRIAEAALAAKLQTGAAMRGAGSTLTEAGRKYGKGFKKGFVKEASAQGPKDGQKVFKWLHRSLVGGAVASASVTGLWGLTAVYPNAFGWLERVLRFLF